MSLEILSARVRHELEMIAHPRLSWLEPRLKDGAPVLDVLIVGAGQSGLATAFGLLREKVTNILLLDRAPQGREGPWATYARMPTLRSPKDYNGPDLNIPCLTFQAWYEAQYGREGFAALGLIPAVQWNDYLQWYRAVLDLPVRNGVTVTRLVPDAADDGSRCFAVHTDDGEIRYARKVVLATGQDGTGRWWMPEFIDALPAHLRAHTCDEIDFASLRGKTVAVLGAGASAFDNAATALEHGAEVHLFCRRAEPSVVQPYRYITFNGFIRHMGDMPDEWRWRVMGHVLRLREGFPQPTYDRVMAFPNFSLHAGAPWTGARVQDGRVVLDTAKGDFTADFCICGTGVEHDISLRPELAPFAGQIARWSDRYAPPEDEQDPRLGRFPYLGANYAFQERVPGTAPFLADLHLFGIGATLSHGPSGSSINAMTIAVPKLVAGLTQDLFAAELPRHWQALKEYDVKQVQLDPAHLLAG